MTKSNNEWVPSVGVPCKFKAIARINGLEDFASNFEYCIPEFLSKDGAVVKDENGDHCFMAYLDYTVTFTPIKTEAEKRREEMVNDLATDIGSLELEALNHPFVQAEELVSKNWIKPKPLTDDVIDKLWGELMGADIKGFAKAIEAQVRGEY